MKRKDLGTSQTFLLPTSLLYQEYINAQSTVLHEFSNAHYSQHICLGVQPRSLNLACPTTFSPLSHLITVIDKKEEKKRQMVEGAREERREEEATGPLPCLLRA